MANQRVKARQQTWSEWNKRRALASAVSRRPVFAELLEGRVLLAGDVPAAPTNLVALAASATQIDIAWTDNADNETLYTIERAPVGGDFQLFTTAGPDYSQLSDKNVSLGQQYRYRVYASNEAGVSAYSAEVTSNVLPVDLTTKIDNLPPLPYVGGLPSVNPSATVTVGDWGYFFAYVYGQEAGERTVGELWKTDGTTANTTFVKSLGLQSQIKHLTVVGDVFYFAADNQLWSSDGTAANTFSLGVAPPANSGDVAAIGNDLYFIADRSLWRTDGTLSGTGMVTQIDSARADVLNLAAAGDSLFFTVRADPVANFSEYHLWTSDGTAGGTFKLRSDLDLIDVAVDATSFVTLGQYVYLIAQHDDYGRELWRSDGTVTGTTLVTETIPGPTDQGIVELTQSGSSIYFASRPDFFNTQLWKTDGTAAGTTQIYSPAGLRLRDMSSTPDGRLAAFFDRSLGGGYWTSTLWIADGTSAGTHALMPEHAWHRFINTSKLFFKGNQAYFYNYVGEKIWKTDFTPAGTTLAFAQGDLGLLSVHKNLLVLTEGAQLWVTEGTAAGLRKLTDIGGGQYAAYPEQFLAIGNTLYFASAYWGPNESGYYPYSHPQELWRTDGTAAGTFRLLKSAPHDMLNVGGTLYFLAANESGAEGLYKSDGTVAGTMRLHSLLDDPNNSLGPQIVGAAGNHVYLRLLSGNDQDYVQLWSFNRTNGQLARVGTGSFSYASLTIGSNLYFYDNDQRLCRTDGSAVSVLAAATPEYAPFAELGGTAYFIRTSSAQYPHSRELFKLASTPGAAFVKVADLLPTNTSEHTNALVIGSTLYFFLNYDATAQLWRSDGTTAGTYAVADTVVPQYMAVVDESIYFANHQNLWKTDGTHAGTKVVRSFADPGGRTPVYFLSVAGKLVYSDGSHLWRSDGTAEGTYQIAPMNEYDNGYYLGPQLNGAAAAVIGNKLYYRGRFNGGGAELMTATLAEPAAPTGLEATAPAGAGSTGVGRGTTAAGLTELTWLDNATTETGYLVDRYDTTTASFEVAAFVPANSTAYVDPESQVQDAIYRVRAYNAGGYSAAAVTGASPVVADVIDVAPDPRSTSVASIQIVFDRPVSGVTLSDFRLTRNAGAIPLNSAQSITASADKKTYTLAGLGTVTSASGTYQLTLVAAGSNIVDAIGAGPVANASDTWSNTAVPPQPVSLRALEDAYVRDGTYATQKFGLVNQLQVKKSGTSYNREAFLRFDLTKITTVSAAKLRLFGKLDNTQSASVNFTVHTSTSTWTEAGVNWNIKPVAGATVVASGTVTGTAGKWYELNLTTILQQLKASGAQTVTLVIKPTAITGATIWFDSDEGTNRPELVVTPVSQPLPPVQSLVVSTKALTVREGAGAAFTVKLSSQPLTSIVVPIAKQSGGDTSLTTQSQGLVFTPTNWNTPQTVTVVAAEDSDYTAGTATFVISSPGLSQASVVVTESDNDVAPVTTKKVLAAVADAYVRDGSTDAGKNFGLATNLVVKKSGVSFVRESYLKFDLSTATTIGTAKLRLYGSLGDSSNSSVTTTIYSSTTTSWSETGITWNNKPVAGTTMRGSLTVVGTAGKYYEVDLTSFLKAEKSAGRNVVTLVLKNLVTTSAQSNFASGEAALGTRPELVIQS